MPTLGSRLQAGKTQSTLLVLYIPSADRAGKSLTQRFQDRWDRRALEVLGMYMGGATAFPRGLGVWRDDARVADWCGTSRCSSSVTPVRISSSKGVTNCARSSSQWASKPVRERSVW